MDDRRSTDAHGHDVIDPLYAAVVTVSSSRADAEDPEDPGGDEVAAAFREDGHVIRDRRVVRDDFATIRTTVGTLCERRDVDVVVATGGTGVTVDDVTPEAVEAILERELPGFGELFRMLSWEEVGSRAMASRATAGIAADTPVFAIPGSTGACQTACGELIVPEAPHLAGLATAHRIEELELSAFR